MADRQRRLNERERRMLRISRETLRHLRNWPEAREGWLATIEAGQPFLWHTPGEDSREAWSRVDRLYELAQRNVEKLGGRRPQ